VKFGMYLLKLGGMGLDKVLLYITTLLLAFSVCNSNYELQH
jgi:hypothetical protein